MPDVGNVHERSAAIFTVYIAQYSPAVTHGQEDNVTVRVAARVKRIRTRQGLVCKRGGGGLASQVRGLGFSTGVAREEWGLMPR